HWGMSGDPVAMMGGGICWIDYDNDGWLDLYAVNSYSLDEAGRWDQAGGLPQSVIYKNNNGKFEDVSEEAGLDLPMRGNGCVAGDLNQDGWTDLYVTTERVNFLFWNNGDGTFTEGGAEAGIDAYGWQTAAAIGDLNGDLLPDLFVAGYVDLNNRIEGAAAGFPRSHLGRQDLLFLNEGADDRGVFTFREVGLDVGLKDRDYEYGLGAALNDFDQDGDLDIFIANDTNPNRLYENVAFPGGPEADPLGIGFRLAEIGQFAEIADENSGMGVAAGDYDNNGLADVVVTNMGAQLHSVYQNTEGLAFEDATGRIGVAGIGVGWTGWGISWADVDLDADQDLIIANGGIPVLDPPEDAQKIQLFSNLTSQGMPGLFQDLTEIAGFTEVDPLLARGMAAADFDNDGDLDLAVNSIGSRLRLLQNDQVGGIWLTVKLEPVIPGTTVVATLPDGTSLTCVSKAGSSYLSSEDPRCHFGLGSAEQVARLSIHWPGGVVSEQNDVAGNQLLEITRPEERPNSNRGQAAQLASLEEFYFDLSLKRGGATPLEVLPAHSPELIALGEALFWDRILSGNKDISCATCHHPMAATGDGLSLSVGVAGEGFGPHRQPGAGKILIPRNAPEIFNRGAAGWETMFWDGRVSGTYARGFQSPAGENLPSGLDNLMAVQAMFPVTSRDEMRGEAGDSAIDGQANELGQVADGDFFEIWDRLTARLMGIPAYDEMFRAAFPGLNPDWLGFEHAANAIAAYEMDTFTYPDSPWDRYLSGDEAALSAEEYAGARLFFGEAGCAACHNGALLTDQKFYNLGVPQLGPGKEEDAPFDTGRGRITHESDDMFAFRTPPLRNVTLTGPWMHNGAFGTLEEAVRHHLDALGSFNSYDPSQLSQDVPHPVYASSRILDTLSEAVSPEFELSDQEIKQILAFLGSLESPESRQICDLVPESVPSGLPVDRDPQSTC
ncbi:MAG: cytochrome c peroxidase, partial [Anaerolineales bacterium]|nr:cytochrome c peroxidase [Anaerolineales bacterium]